MSHSRIYHFKYNDSEFCETDEDSVYEQTQHFADYVEEIKISKNETEWLWQNLISIFGEENIIRSGLSFTIKKEGALDYFKRMRADLYNALQAGMDRPIEEFLQVSLDVPGWWQLKQRIESNFGAHFSIDYEEFKTPTRFAETILHYCDMNKANAITLELKQLFDFHF